MSYIGNTPTNQNFVAGSDQFNGTGSQTVFTLSRNVNTVNDIQVVVSNVPQDPFTAYSVAGNSLTFTSAPPAGTGNVYVVYRATNVQTFVPTPGATVGGSFGIQGNLNFYGTGNRITGDFSNATTTSRLSFQSSTTNGATVVQLIPNGTSSAAQFAAYGGSDILNASVGQFTNNGTEVRVASGIFGTGTYLPITFYTGGSERMRIDTSGNVGIGTSSPATKLNVVGSVSASDSTTATKRLQLDVGASSGTINCANYGSDMMDLNIQGENLIFNTGLIGIAERARIDSSGNLLVNTTSATGRFTVSGNPNAARVAAVMSNTASDAANAALLVSKFDNVTTTSQVFVAFAVNNNAVASGQINANGASSAAFGAYSDRRLKENIEDLPSQLQNILALRPVEFDYIAAEGGGHQIGFIAQEVQEIYPDLIGERADGMLTLTDLNKNDARLIKAIQEQQQMIETLQAEVAALKGAA